MANTAIFHSINRIVQGRGSIASLPEEVRRLGGTRVLVVTDAGLVQTGIPQRVLDLLAGMPAEIYSEVEAEPSAESTDACARRAAEGGFDLIVGLGGGSPIDTAKCAAMLVANGGKAEDYLGIDKVPKPGLPKIFIPTTAGTGSEVTNVAVLSLKAQQTKKGIVSRHLMADAAILDAELTAGLPPAVTAATGMDALTHAIEAYVSRFAQPLTDYFALEAIRRLGRSLRTAVHYGANLDAREDVLTASLYAGLAFGSAATGMVHGLAMPLGGLHNVPHGIANAVLLPHVMKFNLVAALPRFGDIARALGENVDGLSPRAAAERAVAAVRSLAEDIGIPPGMAGLGIPRTSMEALARDGMTNSRQVLPNPRAVTYDGLIGILEDAFADDGGRS